MVRTTPAKVKEIIDHDDAISMSPFIAAASSMVDWLSSQDTSGDLSSSTLALIETWLAAHCYAHRDQLFQEKTTGRSGAVFQGKTGMFLEGTQYGQMALALDTTGKLMNLGKRKGKVSWLGSEYENHDSNDPAYE